MKNSLLIALAVMLVLFMGLCYLQWRAAVKDQIADQVNREFMEKKSAERLAKIAVRDSATSARIKAMQKDSLRHAAVQSSLKTQIRAFRAKLQNLPPAVHDTLIFLQDSLIADLSAERDTIYLANTAVVDSLQRSNLELSELFKGQLKESIKLSGELQREKKKKWVVGPSAGVNYRGEPTVSFGVTYKLFSF